MRSDRYQEFFTAANLMGPNSIRLLDELLTVCPLVLTRTDKALDLGCGTGLTSLFIARETGATVYANDLWIPAEANRERFKAWNMQHRLIPVHEDANCLGFEKEMFSVVVSIDSYHYFGGKEGFFADKVLPFIKPGGVALIAVPGMKNAFDGQSEALTGQWLRNEAICSKVHYGGKRRLVHIMRSKACIHGKWLLLNSRGRNGSLLSMSMPLGIWGITKASSNPAPALLA